MPPQPMMPRCMRLFGPGLGRAAGPAARCGAANPMAVMVAAFSMKVRRVIELSEFMEGNLATEFTDDTDFLSARQQEAAMLL